MFHDDGKGIYQKYKTDVLRSMYGAYFLLNASIMGQLYLYIYMVQSSVFYYRHLVTENCLPLMSRIEYNFLHSIDLS